MNAGFSWLPNNPVNNATSTNYSNGTCSDIHFTITATEDFALHNNAAPFNNNGLIIPSNMSNSSTNIDLSIIFNQPINNLKIRFIDLDENCNPCSDPEETITLINPPPSGILFLSEMINPIYLTGDELSPFDNNPSIDNNDASGWATWNGSLTQVSFRYNRPGQLYGLIIDSIYFDCFTPSQFEMPNVFTPNNDGNNDLFEPVLYNQIFSPHFIIFNRWGNVIFESFDSKPTWNGEFNGKQCLEGVYFWKLDFDDNNMNTDSKHGFFSFDQKIR